MDIENNIIVAITYLIDEVKDFLDKVIIIDAGEVVYSGNYYKTDDLKKIFTDNTSNKKDLNNDILGYGSIEINPQKDLKDKISKDKLSNIINPLNNLNLMFQSINHDYKFIDNLSNRTGDIFSYRTNIDFNFYGNYFDQIDFEIKIKSALHVEVLYTIYKIICLFVITVSSSIFIKKIKP